MLGDIAPVLRRNTSIGCSLFNFEGYLVMACAAFFFKI
jgi:hypothetical protein